MKIDLVGFPRREDRTNYIWNQFQSYLQEQVLDVGCFEAPMRNMIGKERYTGVDISGTPDIVLNLEQCERLPFEDSSYPTVMCMDVLEHLDNLHAMFDELVRVSSRYILISLPNCWNAARMPIARGGHFYALWSSIRKTVGSAQVVLFHRGGAKFPQISN